MSTLTASTPDSLTGSILIVDDKVENLRLLSRMLSQQGYDVRSAINGPVALRAIEALKPDLILLDINMPYMSGHEVCRQLKTNEDTCAIPIIFLSAFTDITNKVKAFETGGVDYITKPFQIEEVLARVHNQLTLRRIQLELQTSNHRLKEEVQQRRTAQQILQESETALRQRTEELELALNELHQTQMQLVQSAKMSSLGQLVAGVAHEINNPLNFIHGNIDHAGYYTGDLLCALDLYRRHYPDPVDEIQEVIEDIDLDFVMEDMPKLLSSMRLGTDRVREIVRSLRNFSHHDRAHIKEVDLHEGIDSTLLILQHQFKATETRSAVKLVKDYGDLPLIECHPCQLNQVFMNIISNAVAAFDECSPSPEFIPEIVIRTQRESDAVTVTIADNGPGMPESVRSRIFDPFYTTKPVGKGTGLGLSISYQIVVDRHGGKLECRSTPGQGTEFIIEIPQGKGVA